MCGTCRCEECDQHKPILACERVDMPDGCVGFVCQDCYQRREANRRRWAGYWERVLADEHADRYVPPMVDALDNPCAPSTFDPRDERD